MISELKKLKDCGPYALGDYVFCNNEKKLTGGIIYQIVQDVEPVKVDCTEKKVMQKRYDYVTSNYVNKEVTKYGNWDAKGKKIILAATRGFIRIKPVFTFFATRTGLKPKGKNGTIIIEYGDIKWFIKPVDIVSLGTKYLELGNIINDIVKRKCEGVIVEDPNGDKAVVEALGEPIEILES